MRRYAPFARDATAGRLHLRSLLLSLSLSRSFIHPRLLGPPSRPLFCAFSLAPSNFLLIVFAASLHSLPPFSFACPFPPFFFFFFLFLFLFQHPMRPTRARESRARYTTHMAGRSLLLAECAVLPPAGDRVTWPPGRNGTQRAARAVLSREPRTRHQSETNRETGPTDRILSPRKRVWCFLPPSLSPILSLSLFLSPFLSIFPSHFHPALSPLFHPFRPPVLRSVARATYHALGPLACAPALLSLPSDISAATCQSPQCCVFTRRRELPLRPAANRGDIFVGYFCGTRRR